MSGPALDRREKWSSGEPPRSSPDGLIALAIEANRRKISYGQLTSGLTEFERFEIVKAYRRGG